MFENHNKQSLMFLLMNSDIIRDLRSANNNFQHQEGKRGVFVM